MLDRPLARGDIVQDLDGLRGMVIDIDLWGCPLVDWNYEQPPPRELIINPEALPPAPTETDHVSQPLEEA